MGTKLCPYELIFNARIEKTRIYPFCFIKNNYFIRIVWRNLKNKIVDLTVKLYCKVNNLNFQISPNYPDKIIFFIKQKGYIRFSSICAWNMSSYGHSLVPKCGVWVPKKANYGFFAPKPYFKGVDRDFFFYRKFCLVEILKRWTWLCV